MGCKSLRRIDNIGDGQSYSLTMWDVNKDGYTFGMTGAAVIL